MRMKLLGRTDLLLLSILIIAAFFRFYNFKELQFWNADDEILTATIRHIIWDKSPTLLIPNLFLEFGLGPIFYYLLTPFYFITNFDLVNLRIIASAIGLTTTYFIYLTGKTLKDKNVGLIAAYLYASSFLVAFLERRIWPLTVNGLMAVFALWCLLKIIDKNYKYIPLLALPIGFTFNSDLSLLVVVIAVFVVWVIYKLPLFTKYTLYFLSIILLFIAPLVLAEIMYNQAVSQPLLKTVSKPFNQQAISPGYFQKFQTADFLNTFSRMVASQPSKSFEQNICHGYCFYPKPLFFPLTQIAIILIFIGSIFFFFRNKNFDKRRFGILWIMIVSFILGILIFNRIFHGNFSQSYFTVIFPTFALLAGSLLVNIKSKSRTLFLLLIFAYLASNSYTILNSSVSNPLYKKIELVKNSIKTVKGENYNLVVNPSQIEGGWTELYTVKGQIPVSSSWYDYLEWIYRAYSLIPTSTIKGNATKTILVGTLGDKSPDIEKIIASYESGDAVVYVIQK